MGEFLHAVLGLRLYTVGTFAESGNTIMLFNDWKNISGYGRIWGVSHVLKQTLDQDCLNICFFDLRMLSPRSPLSTPQHVWLEGFPFPPMTLSKDFDGIVWVRTVHRPQMSLLKLLAYCSPLYWAIVATALGLFSAGCGATVWFYRRNTRAGCGLISVLKRFCKP